MFFGTDSSDLTLFLCHIKPVLPAKMEEDIFKSWTLVLMSVFLDDLVNTEIIAHLAGEGWCECADVLLQLSEL